MPSCANGFVLCVIGAAANSCGDAGQIAVDADAGANAAVELSAGSPGAQAPLRAKADFAAIGGAASSLGMHTPVDDRQALGSGSCANTALAVRTALSQRRGR